MNGLIKSEPVGVLAAVAVLPPLVMAVLVLVVGIDLDELQQAALLALVAGIIGVVAALQRARVTPVGGVGQASDNAGDDAEPYESTPEGARYLDADGDGRPDTP